MIDTHCHLYNEYYDNLDLLIDKIKAAGISAVIVNGCDMKSNLEVLELVRKYDIVYGAIGFQPTELNDVTDSDLEWLKLHINDDKIISQVEDVCNKLIECYKNGHRVYIMGNGGSAADAQHFSAELVGRYMMERKGLPAVAFTTDTSILTAVGNDYGYDDVFRRQTEALVEKGDVVFGISTSGNSKNIYNALKLAKEIGATTIGFLGKTGGTCKELCDIPIVIEYPRTPNIQEAHEMIMHTICEIVEKKLYE